MYYTPCSNKSITYDTKVSIKKVLTFLLHNNVTCIADLSFYRQTISRSPIIWVSTLSVSFLVLMTHSGSEHLAKRIVQPYTKIANRKKTVTISHLMSENAPRQTIYNIIHKYETSDFVGDKPRSDRANFFLTGHPTRLERQMNHQTRM